MSYLGLAASGIVLLDAGYFLYCGVHFLFTIRRRERRQVVLVSISYLFLLLAMAGWFSWRWMLYFDDPYGFVEWVAYAAIGFCLGAIVLARFADRRCAVAIIATALIVAVPYITTLRGGRY